MAGKHYKWHKRWTVDLESATAKHESGFVANFVLLPLTESQKSDADGVAAIGKRRMNDGREFGIATASAVLQETFDTLKSKHGSGNAQQMIARLAREAGEVFEHAQRKGRN